MKKEKQNQKNSTLTHDISFIGKFSHFLPMTFFSFFSLMFIKYKNLIINLEKVCSINLDESCPTYNILFIFNHLNGDENYSIIFLNSKEEQKFIFLEIEKVLIKGEGYCNLEKSLKFYNLNKSVFGK